MTPDAGALVARNADKKYKLLWLDACISNMFKDYIEDEKIGTVKSDKIVTTANQKEAYDSLASFVTGIMTGQYTDKGAKKAATRLADFIRKHSAKSGNPTSLTDLP